MPARIPCFSHLDARAAGIHGTGGPFPLAKGVSVDTERVSFDDEGALVNTKGASVDADGVWVVDKGSMLNGEGASNVCEYRPARSMGAAPSDRGGFPNDHQTHRSFKAMIGGIAIRLATVAIIFVPDLSHAQWTVTYLQPAVAGGSTSHGTVNGVQVGSYASGSFSRACLWTGTSLSLVDLHPDGLSQSVALTAGRGVQAGYVLKGTTAHASLWRGTALSWIELHPSHAQSSIVLGTNGGTQVGSVTIENRPRASLWRGDAASWIDLSPPGSVYSSANGVSGELQVGYARFNESIEAILWRGSAESFLSLHPSSAMSSSASAVHGDQQVGRIVLERNGPTHAALWRGTVESFVDLSPSGSASVALGVFAGRQVGYLGNGTPNRAICWSGTAASWQDLSQALEGSWSQTNATSIWGDARTLYVAGYGWNNSLARYEALLWTRSRCVADADDGSGLGNPDDSVTIDDLLYYITIYVDGLARADVDDGSATGTPDGGVTIDDLLYYLQRFEAGC